MVDEAADSKSPYCQAYRVLGLMRYVELISALSVGGPATSRVELLLGWHPEESRWLTEEEDRAWEDLS